MEKHRKQNVAPPSSAPWGANMFRITDVYRLTDVYILYSSDGVYRITAVQDDQCYT